MNPATIHPAFMTQSKPVKPKPILIDEQKQYAKYRNIFRSRKATLFDKAKELHDICNEGKPGRVKVYMAVWWGRQCYEYKSEDDKAWPPSTLELEQLDYPLPIPTKPGDIKKQPVRGPGSRGNPNWTKGKKSVTATTAPVDIPKDVNMPGSKLLDFDEVFSDGDSIFGGDGDDDGSSDEETDEPDVPAPTSGLAMFDMDDELPTVPQSLSTAPDTPLARMFITNPRTPSPYPFMSVGVASKLEVAHAPNLLFIPGSEQEMTYNTGHGHGRGRGRGRPSGRRIF
ncbi:hypothetical protein PG988_006495 [Apiospora saccharicola]